MIPCPPSFETWYNHPKLLLIFSYFMTAIVYPLHFLGAFCILKHSTPAMSSVKWTILNLHFWNILVDAVLNVLVVPCPLLPAISGYFLGLFNTFGIRSTVQCWVLATSLSFVCMASTMIFENRFYLLVAQNTIWKRLRPFWLLGNHVFCVVFMIPMIIKLPNQDTAKQVVLNALPCVPDFLLTTDVMTPTLDNHIFLYTIIPFCTVVFGQLIIFTVIISYQLSNNFGANTLSETTRKLQRALIKALILQTGTPFLYLLLPVVLSLFAVFNDYFSLTLNNLIIVLASFHGLVSTLSMILIHQPYRKAVVSMLKREKKPESSGTIGQLFTRTTPVESSAGF